MTTSRDLRRPSKPVLDRERRHAKPGGKPQFVPVLEWRDRELGDRFSKAVVALVVEAYPHALAVDGRP